MFLYEKGVFKSSLLEEKGIKHAFSTRAGGVSLLPHTSSMNVGFGRGDDEETVLENIKRLKAMSGMENSKTVYASQIHSKIIRKIESPDFTSPIDACDGFITDLKGISLLVRMADCVPVLFYGKGVVCAVHAGWKGTVLGICKEAVSKFSEYGVLPEEITASIGHCIHSCCFEVKDDFVSAVADLMGTDFVRRHVKQRENGMYADIVSMNVEILKDAGVKDIDVSPYCTACDGELFHSHRKTGGLRGTMGAIISL